MAKTKIPLVDIVVAKAENGEPLSPNEEEVIYQKGTAEQVSKVFLNYPK